MYDKNHRKEVMLTIGESMDELLEKFLVSPDKNWQPTDMLPNSNSPEFLDEVKELQELAMEIDYDLFAVLIGDTITEEALPTYQSWLMGLDGVDQGERKGWSQWVRAWTAEENRHGDILNKYLYLSGRVNMKEMEISTQYLISDGFDIHTATDPYKNFVYTSFQEIATNVSHRRVAEYVKKQGNDKLGKMCAFVAADEARHANAYKEFVRRIFEIDPSEMMVAFQYMMKKKITMPAHFLRESGEKIGDAFTYFSDAAQRANVYTADDYTDILKSLLKDWDIANKTGLNEQAEKARDYVMALPGRLQRISERIVIPEFQHEFKWLTV
jgi:acyl-[acyl-carrier-protein] desaturase